MIKCKCDIEPVVKKGSPVMENGKAMWKHIFICNNPNCENYGREIGETLINIFDNNDVIEKMN